ncbi:DNA repair protein RecN [Methyloceanibacter caenitepidi]|uniref:DNA repair protein RecN n=1 Tax=Methyloceanibacter caenitepidi TaxID=1384459 RepID=A0A0A8K2N3_9HYPH|nr:DNA repair protein RecN [Methyloceanibacter caenitepidi]BAQ17041.1 DNA repair protein RecN [Methyloceanibacter caenitepidi]
MLAALSIRDIVLIDKLDLEFGEGLSALTGETGAGKSILLDALSLALGGRGDASLVRRGAEQGQVTASFELAPEHPVFALLSENGIAIEDSVLILRRLQGNDGRSRAFINDMSVSVQLLREVGRALVEIHGQHDERALIDPSGHRDLVDAFGGLERDAAKVAACYEAWADADAARLRHESEVAAARANADYLAHALEELQKLAPEAGEEEILSSRRQLMMNAEKIAAELDEAMDALQGEGTAGARLASALRRIERQAATAGADASSPFAAVADALERVLSETENARGRIEEALAATAFEPGDLERTEERLFALRALARKHRVQVDALPALQEKLEADLAAITTSESKAAELAKAAEQARAAYEQAALALSKARAKAAKKLDKDVAGELPPLKLEKARFVTKVDTVGIEEGGPSGVDRIAFFVAANPGTDPGPMMKVASGGELARFILALKVVLASRGSAPTLIFDEVESGVGGATAAAVGERLAGLGERVQVLAVTHAPQVAALARGHLRIAKEAVPTAKGEAMTTRVAVLKDEERREEVARMLAGQTITDEARAAADRLMRKSA